MISIESLLINFPKNPKIWILWSLIFIALFCFGFVLRKPGNKFSRQQLIWFAALAVAILLTSTIIFFRIKIDFFQEKNYVLIILPLVSLPWMLAAGLIGIIPSMLLAFAAGSLTAVFHSHHIFTPLYYVIIALFFNYLVAIKQTKLSDELVHTPFSAALWAGLLSLVLIPLQVLFLPQNTSLDFFGLSRNLFVETGLSFVPGIILSGFFVQKLSKEITNLWIPYSFQKTRVSKHPVYQASSLIHSLTQGDYYQVLKSDKSVGKNRVLLNSLENLRASLETQVKISKKLIGLEKLDLKDRSIEELLAIILRAAIKHEGSSARIILFGKKLDESQYELRLRNGLGRMSQSFAYLDETVISRLQESPRLILSDLKNLRAFDFGSDVASPKALIAIYLMHENEKLGVLWIGFDQNYWFTDEDLIFYELLAQRASSAIFQLEKSHKDSSLSRTLTNILDRLSDPILYFDPFGNLIYSNKAAKEHNEITESLISKKHFKELLLKNQLAGYMNNKENGNHIENILLEDGSNYQVLIDFLNNETETPGTLCILKDTSQLQKMIAIKTEFITNVSHDLRTPLSLMKGYATMLPNIGTLNDQQQIFIRRILTGIENMNILINNVLDSERIESGVELQLSNVVLQDAIQNAIRFCELSALQKKIQIETEFGKFKNVIIYGDQILIQQTILNLLDNAIKFSPQGSKVAVIFQKSDSGLRIVIKDEGVGIAPLDQSKVFDRYYKRQTTMDRSSPGYGLGLAIVRSVIEKHGGRVGLTSQLGKGSSFYIDFPEKLILSWE